MSEPLGALTLALAALALLGAWRRPSAGRLALAGGLLGVALLVRADLLVLSPILGAVWVLLARRRAGAGPALAQGAALAVLPLLVAAPWSIYASSQAGRLVPVASSGPSTLFVGTYLPGRRAHERRAPRAGAVRAPQHVEPLRGPHREPQGRARAARLHPRAPPGAGPGPYRAIPEDRLRWALGFEARRNLKTYAARQPLAFAAMEARKVARMWGGYYRGSTRNPRSWITTWHLLLVGLALTGAAAGLALARARRAELLLLLTPVLVSTLMSAVFVAQARHNLRVLPLLVAAGAAGGVLALRALLARRGSPGMPPEADPPGDQITVERRAVEAPTSPRVLRYRAGRGTGRARSGSRR